MDLTIIIVNYQTYKLTKNTIQSILENPCKYTYQIILVDNASKDDSIEKLEKDYKDNNKIKIIKSKTNGGFAYGNNLALKQSQSKYTLLLNSDTIIKPNTLNQCLDYMEKDPKIGALGCKVSLPTGNLDKACKRSFPNPVNSFYKLFHIPNKSQKNNYNLNLPDDGVYEIDCLVGAFMLIRKEAIESVGLLDETFFMYGEDIDYCYRIKNDGWKIVYYGKSEIIHYKGASSKKQKYKLIYEFHKSMYIFYKKHYSKIYNTLLNILVYIGILIQLLIKLFLNIFKKK